MRPTPIPTKNRPRSSQITFYWKISYNHKIRDLVYEAII